MTHAELTEQLPEEGSLKEEDREELKKQLEQFKTQLDRAETELQAIEKLATEIKAIPSELKTTQQKLDNISTKSFKIPDGLTLEQLNEELVQAEQTLELRRKELDSAAAKIKQRPQDLQALPKEIETAQTGLEQARKRLAATNKTPTSISEKTSLARAKLDVLVNELLSDRLRFKSIRLNKVEKLWTLARELARRRSAEQENKEKTWQKEVDSYRANILQREAELALSAAKNAHPAVRDLVLENARLFSVRAEFNQELVSYTKQRDGIKAKLNALNEDFTNLQKRLEVAGLTKTIGNILRNKRDELPKLYELRRVILDIEQKLPEIQLELIQAESERNKLADISQLIEAKISQEKKYINSDQPDSLFKFELKNKVRDAYDLRLEHLNATIRDLLEFSEVLAELDTKTRQLRKRTIEFSNFTNKHVLWIQSTDRIGFTDLKKSISALASLFSVEQWIMLIEGVIDRWKSNPVECVLALAVFITAGLLRKRLKVALRAANSRFAASRSLLFRPTLEATFYTLILSGLWPGLVIFVGWQLSKVSDRSTLPGALSESLVWIGGQYMIASLLYHVTRSDGMAIHHFAWVKALVVAIRNAINLIIMICLPLSFAMHFFDLYKLDEVSYADSAGRFLFTATMVSWVVILYRFLGSLSKYLKENPQSRNRNWLRTWRWILFVSMIITPVGLIIGASLGYYFSATQIGYRIQLTAWFLLLGLMFRSLLSRLLTIARQKITMRQMSFGGILMPRSDEAPPEEESVDIDAIEKQVSSLVSSLTIVVVAVAMWQLWASVLPAVQILDKVELWEIVVESTQEVTLPDNTITTETKITTVPITLTHLLMALGILIITWIVSQNFPGLLEIALLDRLPIDRGGRYAIAVVCRYILVATGVVLAAGVIGVKWGSVQWLIAAMTVGLGFGLQEIFGNFISGIIILLERPVRVGDLVTVSGTTGYVSKIQLRATTITDFDRRELIVPNKKFITDDVINHTLSDATSRMCIPVGIAYGSDTQLAHELLLQVASECKYVAKQPEPYVIFKAFGASSLDFELRIYMETRDYIIEAHHELHMTIDRVFRENNIEIAFPQQDIHIRSVEVNDESKSLVDHNNLSTQ